MSQLEQTGANPIRPRPLLTAKQVAEILQWNPFTVIKKTERGELPGFKLGRSWRYREEDITRWIDEKRLGKAS